MWPVIDVPEPSSSARRRARTRLWAAMADERARRRRQRTRRRVIVVSVATVLTLGVSPAGLDGEVQPLLGLADAVASGPLEVTARHWYARAETRELISVPVSVGKVVALQFLVTAVEETWHDLGDAPRRTKTFGTPVFLSAEDEDVFHAAGLASVYGAGRTVSLPVQHDQYQFAAGLSAAAPEDLGGVLRRRVAGLGDRRLEEIHLLRLTTDMIQLHAADPVMRSQILAVIADIPGIKVVANSRTVTVLIDYLDGDRPFRLMYEFDANSAHLVGEYLAALATQSEPATVLRSARYELPTPLGFSES